MASTRRPRGRPPLVTPERIADAALSLAPGRWSIAAVAEGVGVSETAVYRHAANNEELLVLVIDHVVGREQEPPHREADVDAVAYLDHIARHVRRLVSASTGVASAIVTTGWLGSTDHLDLFLERCLVELSAVGFSAVDADAALNLLLNWTVRWVAGEELADSELGFTDPVKTPRLAQARDQAPANETLFDRHLRALSIGIVAEFGS
ncbi:MAG: TetR/AcrR family transcriptional regulator [Actinomycetota bacterium]